MSRKDTIIVAILINTGLLAVLFMMAVQTEDFGSSPLSSQFEIAEMSRSVEHISIAPSSAKEDDRFLFLEEDSKEVNPKEEMVPAAVASTVVEESGPSKEVTVKRGDSLEKIAKVQGTTVQAIIKANHLSSLQITVGQVLKIPLQEVSSKSVVKTEAEKPLATLEPQYYTLKSGDNPWKVAKQFHVGFGELLKLNNLDEAKARNLKPGDVLRVK